MKSEGRKTRGPLLSMCPAVWALEASTSPASGRVAAWSQCRPERCEHRQRGEGAPPSSSHLCSSLDPTSGRGCVSAVRHSAVLPEISHPLWCSPQSGQANELGWRGPHGRMGRELRQTVPGHREATGGVFWWRGCCPAMVPASRARPLLAPWCCAPRTPWSPMVLALLLLFTRLRSARCGVGEAYTRRELEHGHCRAVVVSSKVQAAGPVDGRTPSVPASLCMLHSAA